MPNDRISTEILFFIVKKKINPKKNIDPIIGTAAFYHIFFAKKQTYNMIDSLIQFSCFHIFR